MKSAIVVAGRSYGASRVIVKRGPQFVQLVNAYRKRRLVGSKISSTHSAQVARSAGMAIRLVPSAALGVILNSATGSSGIAVVWTS